MFINYIKYFSVFIFLLFIFSSVFAVSGIPNRFYGTVTVNGEPATDGVNVVAKVNGVEVASTTTSNGTYGHFPNTFDVTDPNNNMKGKTIEFFVFDVKADENIFVNGAITEINFFVSVEIPVSCGDGACNGDESCSSCPTDCGSCAPAGNPGGSGGGGSGGGGVGGSLNISVSEKCVNKDIEVTVKLSNGRAATNTSVKVLKDDQARTELLSGKTDKDGIYSFNLSEIGNYKLEVRRPAYPTNRLGFSLADCSVLEEVEKVIVDDTGPAEPPTNEKLGIHSGKAENLKNINEGEKDKTNDETLPNLSTGFFGLGSLEEAAIPVLLLLIVIALILVVWKVKL